MMLKRFFIAAFNSALGFILIAPVFLAAINSGHMPQDALENPGSTTYVWFFSAILWVWLVSSVISLAFAFVKNGKQDGSGNSRILRVALILSPVFLPLLYAGGAYLWLFGSQIL